ncbi:hypothetical protein D3C71_1637380 [compost metagenome]
MKRLSGTPCTVPQAGLRWALAVPLLALEQSHCSAGSFRIKGCPVLHQKSLRLCLMIFQSKAPLLTRRHLRCLKAE